MKNYFEATVELIKAVARACGHERPSGFNRRAPTTWKRDIAYLTGAPYGGVVPPSGTAQNGAPSSKITGA